MAFLFCHPPAAQHATAYLIMPADTPLTRVIHSYCSDYYKRFKETTQQPSQVSQRFRHFPKHLLQQSGSLNQTYDESYRGFDTAPTSQRPETEILSRNSSTSLETSIPDIVVTESPEPCQVPSAPMLDPNFLYPPSPSKRSRGNQCNCLWCKCSRINQRQIQEQQHVQPKQPIPTNNIRSSILGILKTTKKKPKDVDASSNTSTPATNDESTKTKDPPLETPEAEHQGTDPQIANLTWIPSPGTSETETLVNSLLLTSATIPPLKQPLPSGSPPASPDSPDNIDTPPKLLTAVTSDGKLVCRLAVLPGKAIDVRKVARVLLAGSECVNVAETKRERLRGMGDGVMRFCGEREEVHKSRDGEKIECGGVDGVEETGEAKRGFGTEG